MNSEKILKVHVIKKGSGWIIYNEGNERASKFYSSKEDAIADGYKKTEHGGDLIIHTASGTIDQWKSYKSK